MVINVDPLSIHNPGMLMAHFKICDPSNDQMKQIMPLFLFLIFSPLSIIHSSSESVRYIFFGGHFGAHRLFLLCFFFFDFFNLSFDVSCRLINSCRNGDINFDCVDCFAYAPYKGELSNTNRSKNLLGVGFYL